MSTSCFSEVDGFWPPAWVWKPCYRITRDLSSCLLALHFLKVPKVWTYHVVTATFAELNAVIYWNSEVFNVSLKTTLGPWKHVIRTSLLDPWPHNAGPHILVPRARRHSIRCIICSYHPDMWYFTHSVQYYVLSRILVTCYAAAWRVICLCNFTPLVSN